ncbi:MAG: Kinetochore Sim4 complex subunit [Candidatus Parcubacteria bacterium]
MFKESFIETAPNEPGYLDRLASELERIKDEDEDAKILLKNITENTIPEDKVRELVKDRLNLEFETMLRKGVFLEAGNNGIVFSIDPSVTSKLTHALLHQEHIEFGDEQIAAKILKVYDAGKGAEEFGWQTKAYETIEQYQRNTEGEQDTIAHIPKPLHIRDQNISPDIKEYLQQLGGRVSEKAEFILMEYVDGKDLATTLYERILKSSGYDEEAIKKLSFSDKQNIVADNLNFTQPHGKARDEGAREFERIKILNENVEKIKTHLRKKLGEEEIVIEPSVFEKIQKTITILHENGIYHNDLHERNIMIDRNGKTYIIDFGTADSTRKEGRPDDVAIIRNWKEFAISNKQKKSKEKTNAWKELEKIEAAILKSTKLISLYKTPLEKAIGKDTEGTGKELLKQFKAFSITDDRDAQDALIMLKHIRDELSNKDTSSEQSIRNFLKLLKEEKIHRSIKNKVQELEDVGFL